MRKLPVETLAVSITPRSIRITEMVLTYHGIAGHIQDSYIHNIFPRHCPLESEGRADYILTRLQALEQRRTIGSSTLGPSLRNAKISFRH